MSSSYIYNEDFTLGGNISDEKKKQQATIATRKPQYAWNMAQGVSPFIF